MTRYAARTEVPWTRSRDEIERTLQRYGASAFAYGWEQGRSIVQFHAHDRRIQLELPLPDRTDFRYSPTGRSRPESAIDKEWEQACRQAWRALALVVKAKLEAVAAGIADFEEEFLAYVMLPNGSRVGEFIRPEIERVYLGEPLAPMLPGGSE